MFKQILLIASLVVVAYSLAVPNLQFKIKDDQKLSALLMRSTAQMERSPSQTAACFAEYMPKLNNLTAEFEKSLNLCDSKYEGELATLENNLQWQRSNVTITATDTCKAYADCNEKEAVLDFFSCYAQVAGEATKSSFYIQKASNDEVEYINMFIKNILYDRNVCSNAAQLKYVEESSQTYADLDKCLADAQ